MHCVIPMSNTHLSKSNYNFLLKFPSDFCAYMQTPFPYRNESEAIKSIVEYVTCLLEETELFIVNNLVGVESRIQDMI